MSIEEVQPTSMTDSVMLVKQEAIIAQGLTTFYAVGSALLTIRDQRLYRQDHGTFEDYCAARWNIARRTAYQLMEAAVIVDDVRNCAQDGVSPIGDILPTNEAQARPLAALPSDQRAAAWQEAVETAPEGKVTAAHVAATVRDIQRTAPAAPYDAPPFTAPHSDVAEAEGALRTIERGRLPVPPTPFAPRHTERDEAAAERRARGLAAITKNDPDLTTMKVRADFSSLQADIHTRLLRLHVPDIKRCLTEGERVVADTTMRRLRRLVDEWDAPEQRGPRLVAGGGER